MKIMVQKQYGKKEINPNSLDNWSAGQLTWVIMGIVRFSGVVRVTSCCHALPDSHFLRSSWR